MKPIRCLILSLVVSLALVAQSSPHTEFEVASIKPSPPGMPTQVSVGVHIDGAQVRCTYLSLKDYIRIAYRVKDYQVLGPDWLATEKFDIAAKIADGANREQIPEMLQALVTDRFQVKMHREKKEFPVYALIVAKGGPKMKESAADLGPVKAVDVAASGGPGGVNVDLGRGSGFSFGNNRMEGRRLDMPRFAEMLSRFTDRPVVDMTELTGTYDFTLEFTPEDYRAMLIRSAIVAGVNLPPEALHLIEQSSGDSLFSSVQLLGLKLDARKSPLDVLVIDSAQKTPTEN